MSMVTKARRVILAVAAALLITRTASARPADPPEPPVAPGEAIEVNGQDAYLIMTVSPRPRYPREANGVSGWVRVECLVSPKGRITRVRIVDSQPAGVFDAAAVEAMKAVRFK